MTGSSPRRRALLLGCGTFADPTLAPLRSPRQDVNELAGVLRDPDRCRYAVTARVDCTSQDARREIEGFFAAARPTDTMSLLYLSCHGVQDRQGRLYFAFTDTERDLLGSTAVSAEWVRDCIHSSRSKATLVLVDCCFSGGFIKGMRSRSSGANVESLVQEVPPGTGVAVLTASGDTEASFEDAQSPVVGPSYFTGALISGITSGQADRNRDGRITADELYDYVYDEIRRGPSPQRPRRLGSGEGALVVADAALSTPPPVPVTTAVPRARTLIAQGVLGWVSFDGQWLVLGKNGVGHIYKGERRYHVRELSGVAMKAATRLHHGYLQAILPGVTPAPVVRFGPNAGRPPLTDDDTISFAHSANDAIIKIRDALQDAISGVTRPPPVSFSRGPSADVSRSTPARADTDPGHVGREADHHRGTREGARMAATLPLAALADLSLRHFDVVLWLTPWRQRSSGPVPPWLVELAGYLGGHAAPAGSTNSGFTPSPAYLSGFCAGLRDTWNDAVSGGLLPADRTALSWWMAQPAGWLRAGSVNADATIADLTRARRGAKRIAATKQAARIVLWVTTGIFALMEIAAIAISIEGGWTDETGNVAADQRTNTIGANLACSIPLLILCTMVVVDLRRSRRTVPPPADQ
ncbi:caspase family protein [Actinoplanes subglobosus]|uniref:Caspase domain-containing protein n=1 Tax=Actinoplanes subglobosus TaxID=1547892 RepID=A0ABV8IWC1_9ACTN